MKTKRRSWWALLGTAILACSILELPTFVGQAHAIIGRPLTPLSFAGVARRTTRRAMVAAPYVAAPYAAAPYAAAPYAAAPYVAAPAVRVW